MHFICIWLKKATELIKWLWIGEYNELVLFPSWTQPILRGNYVFLGKKETHTPESMRIEAAGGREEGSSQGQSQGLSSGGSRSSSTRHQRSPLAVPRAYLWPGILGTDDKGPGVYLGPTYSTIVMIKMEIFHISAAFPITLALCMFPHAEI